MRLMLLQFQVSVAVLAVLVLRIGMRKLPKIYSYGLWVLVFVRLLCPIQLESRFSFIPSMAESTLWFEQSLVRLTGEEQISLPENDMIVDQVDAQNKDDPFAAGEQGLHTGADSYKGASGMPNFDAVSETNVQTKVESGVENQDHIGNGASIAGIQVFSFLWALGFLGIVLYNGAALVRVRRRLRDAGHFTENVYISKNIKAPFTFGLLKPRIFLPAGLKPDEQEYILCHEHVHIKRKDYLVKNLVFLLTAVYWFNPFVWLAFYFLERDMEMACDEKVISIMGSGIKRQYSQSLLNFAQGRDDIAVTTFAFGGNNVKQRVKNVLSYNGAKTWGIVIGILILLAAAFVFFTARSGDGNTPDDQSLGMGNESGSAEGTGNAGHQAEVDPSDVRTALGRWAEAFIDGDSETLWQFSYDKDAFEAWDLAEMKGNKTVSFGYANLWSPQDYRITWQEGDDTALIRYYVKDSLVESAIPTIFVADETVTVTWEEGLCYVDHLQMKVYDRIETREQFEELYGQGDYDFAADNTGYGTEYYRALIRYVAEARYLKSSQADDSGYAMLEYPDPETNLRLLDKSPRIYPDKAAGHLLHLGRGRASVEYDGVPMSAEDWDINWLEQMNWLGEGSLAYVTYTFEADRSQVVIPMELIDASAGIWAPAGSGFIRQVYQTRSIDPLEEEVFVQISQYGIYLLDRQGLRCVYPYYVLPDVSWTIEDWKLYFEVDSQYQEGDLAYSQPDSVCVLDLQTGEFHLEALPLPVD